MISPGERAPVPAQSLEECLALREGELRAYQDEAYAQRYRDLVARVHAAELHHAPHSTMLTQAVARSYYQLLACKDEYEVARLYADAQFQQRLDDTFSGPYRLRVHLAPPLFARRDRNTGEPRKIAFGAWILPLMRVLALCRRLRGTRFDPFGYTRERKTERRLIVDFERDIERLLRGLTPSSMSRAVELARLPQQIRGFGHVKQASIEAYEARRDDLMRRFEGEVIGAPAAEAQLAPARIRAAEAPQEQGADAVSPS
jgi:indolepyruvate ferredoxin oxidoreductase